jgi:hypothetical protein
MEREPFVVDLNNPDDMRVKLADAEAKVAEYDKQLKAMQEIQARREHWRETANFLRLRVGTAPDDGRDASVNGAAAHVEAAQSPAEASDEEETPVWMLASEVVNREMRKIRSREVCAILQAEGHNVEPNSVSNALYYATHKAKTVKPAVGRGMYAPLAFEEETHFDQPPNGQVSQARPEEPYSAPEGEDQRKSPGDSMDGVSGGPVNQTSQQTESALNA